MHQQQIRAIPSLIRNSKDFISNSRSKIRVFVVISTHQPL
jgi:hypothetical protein